MPVSWTVGIKHSQAPPYRANWSHSNTDILTPVPRIAERINEAIVPLLNPLKFTVGLQIRTGDLKAFGKMGDTTTVKDFEPYFVCASKMQSALGYGRPLQLFLVSDSMSLKKDAERVYGDAMIVTDAVPKHVGITNELEAFKETAFGAIKPTPEEIEKLNRLNQTAGAKAGYNETDAYDGAILELWTLSYAAYKVISPRSGFGNVAAFRRYWVNPRSVVRGAPGWNGWSCGTEKAWTNYTDLATHWSMGRRKKRGLWDYLWDNL